MVECLFLYREKENDRDCCAYIEGNQPRFECNHYFGRVILHGACYCNSSFADYEDIETILTESEYQALQDYDKTINNLGYGITKGDERYQQGIKAYESVAPIFEKLRSEEAKEFQQKIIESEIEYIKDEFNLDDDDVETIFNEYGLDYRDRAIIGCVYDNTSDLGYEEAYSFGYINRDDDIISRYFDYEQFGKDLVEEEYYLELDDGRVVSLNY